MPSTSPTPRTPGAASPRPQGRGAAARAEWALNVVALIDRPGTSRPLALELPAPDGLDESLVSVRAPLRLDGVVESVVDGMLVRATLSAPVALACGRCLTDLSATVQGEVVELFRDPAALDPDDEIEAGYELLDGHLDLETLVRDALVPAVPARPLCREDCAGLCPTCGIDRNLDACACDDAPADPRWSALTELRLPEA